jgi:hypothetical protein
MFLNLCDVLEQSLLDTIITFSSLGIITNFSSIDIFSDINLVVYILSIMDFHDLLHVPQLGSHQH